MERRSESFCPIVGPASDISPTVLPRRVEVLRYYRYVDSELKKEGEHWPARAKKAELVAKKVMEIWEKASLPTTSLQRISKMVSDLCTHLAEIKKIAKKNAKKSKKKVEDFQTDYLLKLFDVCSCKCKDKTCTCPKEKKIPPAEQEFLKDQRGPRKMFIGKVDTATTRKLENRQRRRAVSEERSKKRRLNPKGDASTAPASSSESTPNETTSGSDSETARNSRVQADIKRQRRAVKTLTVPLNLPKTLPTFSRVCERRGLSSREAAELGSSLLEDFGIVSQESKDAVIDRSKVERERRKLRRSLVSTAATATVSRPSLQAVYFDGRDDLTMMIEKTPDGRSHRIQKKEKHISLVEEPDSLYLGHFAVTSGTAAALADGMEAELSEKGYNLADLKALGCDGTAVNTGKHGGVIRLIEKKLSKPLQWVVCMLHLNELPLRALFEHLDGPTSGPTGFSGPIGKALKNCHEKAICNFLPIQHNVGNVTADDLSTDQEYLKAICEAVSARQSPESLANKHPGNLSHSRWLTLANRVCRLYVATPKPSANLKILTRFIVQVYGPAWFEIKQKHSIFNAAPNFYRIIQLSRYLPRKLRLVVDEFLQCNAFMAHPETILLAMLVDDRSDIRNLAIERIQNARAGRTSNVRQLVPPTVNFNASDYTELVDWSKTEVTEPPLMSSMSTEELRNLCTQQPQPWMFKLPAHTQAVERLVKDVTEASKQVCGNSSRDGFIRARQLGRRAQPTFETKGQYRTGDLTVE